MRTVITIVGSQGFIGRKLSLFFKKNNYSVIEIDRNTKLDSNINYGTVFYCAGICVDFQKRIFDTVDAHIVGLRNWLEKCIFDKFVYISSTRIYVGQQSTCENTDFFVTHKNDIYCHTKLMGELACLSSERSTIILRLSNIIGYDEKSPYFLWSVFRQAKNSKAVILEETLNSHRDYLSVDDFLLIADRISSQNMQGIYNVASSINTNHSTLEDIINDKFNCSWSYGQKSITHPKISNYKIISECGLQLSDPHVFINNLFNQYLAGDNSD